eukprot:Skav217972  [mRNA]  locus=scaffold496:22272:25764:- [translate_table: standard]
MALDFELSTTLERGERASLVSEMGRQMNLVFSVHFMAAHTEVVTMVIMSVCFTLNLVYFGSLFAFPQVLPLLMHGQAASELLVGALWELPGLALGLLLGITASRRTSLKFYLTALTCLGPRDVPFFASSSVLTVILKLRHLVQIRS